MSGSVNTKFHIPANFINGECGGMPGRGLKGFHWGVSWGGDIDVSLEVQNQI